MAWQGELLRALSSYLRRLTRPSFQVLESEHEMDTSRIISFGISLAGGGVLEVRHAVRHCCASRLLTAPPFALATGPLSAGAGAHSGTQPCCFGQEGYHVMDFVTQTACYRSVIVLLACAARSVAPFADPPATGASGIARASPFAQLRTRLGCPKMSTGRRYAPQVVRLATAVTGTAAHLQSLVML